MYNYVDNQRNKLVKMAADDYKEIESDIYDYAAYLQGNELASSLTFEPISIMSITYDLESEIKNINTTLIQDKEMSMIDKSRQMRDFLMEWMEKFKKKEKEQKDVIEFKTKCIRKFVEMMKKWLGNWDLKQEYLVGLRKQFAVQNNDVDAKLKAIA